MTSTLVYLSGEPGAGKTTLMRELTGRWRATQHDPDARGPARLMYDTAGGVVAVELGRRRESFSGTDALPSSVIASAVGYLSEPEAPLILAEGARLANLRFLNAALDAGHRVVLAHLTNPAIAASRRTRRAVLLGVPEQNPSWVKGRRTAAANLAERAPAAATVVVLDAGDAPALQRAVLTELVPELLS